jgi:hypothetical protein
MEPPGGVGVCPEARTARSYGVSDAPGGGGVVDSGAGAPGGGGGGEIPPAVAGIGLRSMAPGAEGTVS